MKPKAQLVGVFGAGSLFEEIARKQYIAEDEEYRPRRHHETRNRIT